MAVSKLTLFSPPAEQPARERAARPATQVRVAIERADETRQRLTAVLNRKIRDPRTSVGELDRLLQEVARIAPDTTER